MSVLPGGSVGKEFACNAGDPSLIPGWGRSPGEGMATHSSILARRIPWTEEPGSLQSMGSQRDGHDSATIQQQRFCASDQEVRWNSDELILLPSVALAEVAQDVCLVDGLSGGSNVSSWTCLAPRQGWPGRLGSSEDTRQSTCMSQHRLLRPRKKYRTSARKRGNAEKEGTLKPMPGLRCVNVKRKRWQCDHLSLVYNTQAGDRNPSEERGQAELSIDV